MPETRPIHASPDVVPVLEAWAEHDLSNQFSRIECNTRFFTPDGKTESTYTFEEYQSGKNYVRATLYVDSEGQQRFRHIANRRYFAVLSQGKDGSWNLQTIAMRGTRPAEHTEQEVRRRSPLEQLSNFRGTLPRQFYLSTDAKFRDVVCRSDGDESLISFRVELPQSKFWEGHRVYDKWYHFTCAKSKGWLPIKIVGEHRLGAKFRIEFGSWSTTNGLWYPQEIKTFGTHPDVSGEHLRVETTYHVSGVSFELGRRECFLSHYGLPEPDDENKWSYRFLTLGAAAAVAALGLWFKKQLEGSK